jgi:PAS domain S-box-containing protein
MMIEGAPFSGSAEAPGGFGVWDIDLSTGVLSASPRCLAHLGLVAERPLLWSGLEAALDPDDRERWRFALAHAIECATEFDFEYRVVAGDGRARWVHLRAQVVFDAAGAAVRLSGVSWDLTERRTSDLQMEISEESLRLAADAAEVGTWDLDLATDTLTWSDRTKAMFGISPDVQCSMADFYGGLHPEDFEATSAAFASAIDPAIRATYDVEYRTVGREDGRVRWVAAKGKGLFVGGHCRRAIGTAIDITARKQAASRQRFLLELLDRLRLLNDPAEIAETAVQALGRHLGASRVGYGRVQADDETIILETCYADGVEPLRGAFPLDSFGPHTIARQRLGLTAIVPDVNADPANDPALWASIETRAFVSAALVRDGRFRASLFVNHRDPHDWADQDVALIEDVAGRIWDALERARAEEALRQLNASLEQEVESRTREIDRTWRLSPVVMVVGAADGTLLETNPAWTRLLGWSREDTIGRNVMEFVAPDSLQTGAEGMERLFQGLPVVELQIGFVAKDGRTRRIAWTTVPDHGRLYGFGSDITDQLTAEEQLRQAQKMEAVGQLTGGLAHDFNNLLTGVTGSLELIRTRLDQGRPGDAAGYIEMALGAPAPAAALTQRLLAFSRRQALDPKPTGIDRLIDGMAQLLRSTVGPGIETDVALPRDLWAVLVDPHQLENALLNLCINARDAMPDGGRLTIGATNRLLDEAAARALDLPAGPYLVLAVSDTGVGMTLEVQRRAFDPFFTTKPLGSGTGLGLSMIYGFARQSGGQACIESTPGVGSTIRIYLPRHAHGEPADTAPAAPAPIASANAGGTVLLVDDEGTIRDLACDVLKEYGHAVIQAETGAAGLKILHSGAPIDLLVTDVGLPGGINGRQLADAARMLRPELPVLFITGYAEGAALGKGQLAPGMHVLTKPFSLGGLANRVGQLIAPRRGAG